MNEWYEEWFNEDYLALYAHRNQAEADAQVEALLPYLKGNTLLDIGCGAGRYALAFAKRGYIVTGIDLSEVMLKEAKKLVPQATFLRRDMRDLQGLGPFDIAVSFFTSFGYFDDKSDDQRVIDQVSSCVKSQFFLDTIDPSHINLSDEEHITRRLEGKDRLIKTIRLPHKTYMEKVRLYSPEALTAMLKRSGFSVTRIDHPTRLQLLGEK